MTSAAPGIVGLIANPASGKDIRRLVAHASTFDNNEKINIVRRALLALDSLGVREVWHMPDTYAICARAAETTAVKLRLVPLPMEMIGNASDSYEAARRLADAGAACIVTLGGDGTNRIVAKGAGRVPLVPISTGTNNVFPTMVEGTLAGLAAGLVAIGAVGEVSIRQERRLVVELDNGRSDVALIDVVSSPQAWIGARAVWEPTHLREIVLSRVSPAAIGFCGVGGLLFPEATGSDAGVHILLGDGGERVLAPIAPGVLRELPIASARLLHPGESVQLAPGAGTLALDGEREIELLRAEERVGVTLGADGPRVVDILAAIAEGARNGAFSARPAPLAPSAPPPG
jgi:predicted polyphosphate/ATP-dependent NAD kinase